MKADPADLVKLLELQAMDTAIEQAKHKAQNLPVHQAVSRLTDERLQALDDLSAAKTALLDATAAQTRAEADVVPVKERLIRNQRRVDAGEMDPKALSTAVDEIAHLKQRLSDLEDAELAAMEAVEAASTALDQVTSSVGQIEQALREQLASRDAEVAELAGEAKALAGAKAKLSGEIPAAVIGLYEKIRARANGIGVAKLVGKRCSGCRLEATVADYNRYVGAAADELLRCAECDRILVR